MKEAACIFIYVWVYLSYYITHVNLFLHLHLQLLLNDYTDVLITLMFSFTWQTLPTVFSVPKTSFLWQKTNHICISEKKHYQPSNSLIPTATEVTSCMVMHSSKQNRWPLAALRQQSCSRTDIMENPKMRREEKCQALLLKATGCQPRMDRVLTEPEESAKGAKDKKNWISMGPTHKDAKSSDTKHDPGICGLLIHIHAYIKKSFTMHRSSCSPTWIYTGNPYTGLQSLWNSGRLGIFTPI